MDNNDRSVILQFADDKSQPYFIRELENISHTFDDLLQTNINIDNPITIPFNQDIFENYLIAYKSFYEKDVVKKYNDLIYYKLETWILMYKPLYTIDIFILNHENLVYEADMDIIIEILNSWACNQTYVVKNMDTLISKILSHYRNLSLIPQIMFQYVGMDLLIHIYDIKDNVIRMERILQYLTLIKNFHSCITPRTFTITNIEKLIENTNKLPSEDRIFLLTKIGEKCIPSEISD